MAIRGLVTERQPSAVNVTDEVGASVEALEMLGLVQDRNEVTGSITAELNGISQSGRTGELYIALNKGTISLWGLIAVLDGGVYAVDKKYPETYVYDNLWTPGARPNGYTPDELDNLTTTPEQEGLWTPHARLAVYNPESEQGPLLHFLGLPYDEKHAESGQQTQLEVLAAEILAYEAEQGIFAMTPLNAKAVAMIALTRRIKGEPMPMAWGYMRDATLPRKPVDGDSYVGGVYSCGRRLSLDGSYGDAGSRGGVGVSVGPKQLELQAS